MPSATFSVNSGSRPDSVGGGVVADIFQHPREVQWGGGEGRVVPESRFFFCDLPDSVGGG